MAHSRKPVAHPLVQEIAEKIRRGKYPPDSRLPSEGDMAEARGIARATVRKAYEQLAQAGLVRSVRGHGWYVRADERLRYPLLTIDSGRAVAKADVWLTFLAAIGRRGDHQLAEVVSEPPPEKIRTLLRLGPDEHAVARRRIRRVDGDPWMLSTSYFPAYIAYGTPIAESRDMQNPSPLRWLIENGFAPTRHEDLISARMPTATEAEHLRLDRGTPLITVYRTSWDRVGRPVRCGADVLPAHRFELVVTQENPQ